MEIVYRLDPERASPRPASADEVRRVLREGNERFARLRYPSGDSASREVIPLGPRALGLPDADGEPPTQSPFAAVLGCADARVPVELVFQQAVNDLFVVRVAGNVLGEECLGSIEFALSQLDSVHLAVVLGHSSCGAVTAGVDAFSRPARYLSVAPSQGLRAVVDRVLVSVRIASLALSTSAGNDVEKRSQYRQALIETSVIVNAALTAMTLRREVGGEVAFGVYDLATRRVRVPGRDADGELGLSDAPADLDELHRVATAAASSRLVRSILDG